MVFIRETFGVQSPLPIKNYKYQIINKEKEEKNPQINKLKDKHTLSSLNLDLMFWSRFANTLQVEVLIHLDPNFLEPNKCNENNKV